MKTIISILFLAASVQAQSYYYLYDAPMQKLDCPPDCQGVNLRDRNGDVKDYRRTGLGCYQVNTLVDARTGYYVATTNITDGMSNLLARAVAVAYDASTNYTAAVVKVTGGGKTLKDLRKANKKNKADDVVEALTARIEMLEAMIRQSGRMTPGQAMGEE